MRNSCGKGIRKAIAAVAGVLAGLGVCVCTGQPLAGGLSGYGAYPAAMGSGGGMIGVSPGSEPNGRRMLRVEASSAAPLARVIRNPDSSDGSPPYALTDHAGTIQRYVEPVPGIDLEPYIGGIVRVRHDTGRTLLASQLELPPQPLRPLLGELDAPAQLQRIAPRSPSSVMQQSGRIRRTEFVDDDDSTVQLLAEGEELFPDGEPVATGPDAEEPAANFGYRFFPNAASPEGGPMYGPAIGDGLPYGEPIEMSGGPMVEPGVPTMPPDAMLYGEGLPGRLPMCPQCGGYCLPPGCEEPPGMVPGSACQCGAKRCRYYADVQLNFLRTHVLESFGGGKLSEKYEFSPRIIVGFDGIGRVDGRARYWHYGRNTPFLDSSGSIRVDFDVFDFEATRTIELERSALLFAAGLRTANIKLDDDDGDTAGASMLGMTMAADFETHICDLPRGRITGDCSARLSLLGGDWGQDDGHDIVPIRLRDDNVVVDELYAGVGYHTCYRQIDLHAQLGFEIQNWHSDALSQFAGGDSISFIGPGIEIGAEF